MANGVANEARVPILIAQEIVDILQDHLALKPLVIAERSASTSEAKVWIKMPVPTLQLYETVITLHCEFGTFLDDALRDRAFVVYAQRIYKSACFLRQS